jgi:hypothetical protein
VAKLSQEASVAQEAVINPRSNRVILAVLFAVLWGAGILWRSPAIDLRTVVTAVIAGAIVGGLMYWLFDKFSGRLRG